MKNVRGIIVRACNQASLAYWGAFGFIAEQALHEAAAKAGLKAGTDFIVEREYSNGAAALASPVALQVFSQRMVEFDSSALGMVGDRYVKPASLVFSVCSDGGVLALMYPFEVDRPTTAGAKESTPAYVVGVLRQSQSVSDRWVTKCAEKFFELVCASHPSTTPTAATQNVMKKVAGRSNRLRGAAAEPTQAEFYSVSVAAVISGVIALILAAAQLSKDFPDASAWAFATIFVALVVSSWIAFRRLYLYPH